MKISGKCKLANKWTDGVVDKTAFDFENKGKIGKGRLTWTDVVKGRNGEKDTFIPTTKKFICFGDVISFIEKNMDQYFEIKGSWKTEKFTTDTGKAVSYDQVVVNEATLFVKKEGAFSPSPRIPVMQEFVDDNDVPF
jgi:hypothetical protein